MTIAFIDGFGKYGPPAASATVGLANNTANYFNNAAKGNWAVSTGNNGSVFIGPGIDAKEAGSLCILGPGGAGTYAAVRSSPNYANAVGGCRFVCTQYPLAAASVIRFLDISTQQATISIDSQGHMGVMNSVGTTIGTSSIVLTLGSAHYLEWNFQMLSSANWSLYLDGVLILSGSAANFRASANNFYNAISLQSVNAGGISPNVQFSSFYQDDGAGTPLLSNPIVESQAMTSDSVVTFVPQAYAVGYWNPLGTTTVAPGANSLFLRKFTTPAAGVTLNSVGCVPQATSAGALFKSVLYNDSAGSPNTLLVTGAQVTGCTAGIPLVSTFAGQVLTGNTAYWIGFITDTSVVQTLSDSLAVGVFKANTYGSGAPTPAGAVTTGQSSWLIWGNCNALANNFSEVAEQAPLGLWGDYGYVSSPTLNNEDLYNVAALQGAPINIHCVQVSGFMKNSAAGTRNLTLNTKSALVDTAGSLAAAVPNATAYQWFSSVWLTDPNTSAAWTLANLNAAKAGYKITV